MAIYQRGKSWYYDFVHKRQRYMGSFGNVSRSVAKEELARKKAEVLGQKLNPTKARKGVRFEVFAVDYLEWSKANKKPRSYERDITSLVALRPLFTGKMLSDISPWLIEKYKKERKDKGRSNQTVTLDPAHKRRAIEALESRFSAKSPANFHDTPTLSPLPEIKKAM